MQTHTSPPARPNARQLIGVRNGYEGFLGLARVLAGWPEYALGWRAPAARHRAM